MAKDDKKKNNEVEADGIPVIAEEPCYYNDVYREEGAKFTVDNEKQLSKVMRRLDGKPHPKDTEQKKKDAEKAASAGKSDPRVKELKQPETIADAKDHLI